MRQTRLAAHNFITREDETGDKYISGYFSVFNSNYEMWQGATESIAPGAFDGALDDDIRCLEEGVDIGECITKPAVVERICENEINLTITEGKFHQIKRMAFAVGNSVIYLKRLSYGKVFLDETLSEGEYRPLTEEEVTNLYNVYKRK